MKILFLCKRFYTNKDLIKDRYGRLYHFPVCWSNKGHKVNVVAVNYHSRDMSKHIANGVSFESISIKRLFVSIKNLIPHLSRKRYDIVISSGDQLVGMLGLIIARLNSLPFVFDVYDDYSEFDISRFPSFKWIYQKVIKNSNYISCVSKNIQKKVSSFNKNIKIGIFPNGTNTQVFYLRDKIACREYLGLNLDCYYIGYTGSIDARFDYLAIISAIRCLRKDYNVKMLIAGKNIANINFNADEIVYIGQVDQSLVPVIIGASDVMVAPYADHPLSHCCNPCKISEYLACERPVVAAKVSDVACYLNNDQFFIYNCGDTQELLEKIKYHLLNPKLVKIPDSLLWHTIADSFLEELYCIINDKVKKGAENNEGYNG
ncbi:glycosyltransferase [Desulfobotulus mexicanus]|nr:glycosyltransferase [Desulfobotulus mexicanus]